MKKIKTLVILLLLSVITTSIFAQNQTTPKFTYAFINEYGFYFGGMSANSGPGFAGIFVNGVKFNNGQDLIGIGLGYEVDGTVDESIPIFINYRHIFPTNVKVKPIVNFALGTRFSSWTESSIIGYDINLVPIYSPSVSKSAFGIYSTIAAGFQANAFSLSSGFFFKSVGSKFYSGIEIKCGFTL